MRTSSATMVEKKLCVLLVILMPTALALPTTNAVAEQLRQWLSTNNYQMPPHAQEALTTGSNSNTAPMNGNDLANALLKLLGLTPAPVTPLDATMQPPMTTPTPMAYRIAVKASERDVCPFGADPLRLSNEYAYCKPSSFGECPVGYLCDHSYVLKRSICCQDLRGKPKSHPIIKMSSTQPPPDSMMSISPGIEGQSQTEMLLTGTPTIQDRATTHLPQWTPMSIVSSRRAPWYIKDRLPWNPVSIATTEETIRFTESSTSATSPTETTTIPTIQPTSQPTPTTKPQTEVVAESSTVAKTESTTNVGAQISSEPKSKPVSEPISKPKTEPTSPSSEPSQPVSERTTVKTNLEEESTKTTSSPPSSVVEVVTATATTEQSKVEVSTSESKSESEAQKGSTPTPSEGSATTEKAVNSTLVPCETTTEQEQSGQNTSTETTEPRKETTENQSVSPSVISEPTVISATETATIITGVAVTPRSRPKHPNQWARYWTTKPTPQNRVNVSVLQSGSVRPVGDAGERQSVGAITLIKDNGRLILVDTGAASDTERLLKSLTKESVTPEDIDTVVITHGHPGHMGNLNFFGQKPILFHWQKYIGQQVGPSELENRPFMKLSKNSEVWKTPGHSQHDLSVIVHNVPGYGSMATVGDLIPSDAFLSENNDEMATEGVWDSAMKRQNANLVICMVDWIIPGHGQPFRVLPRYRQKAGCTRLLAQQRLLNMA